MRKAGHQLPHAGHPWQGVISLATSLSGQAPSDSGAWTSLGVMGWKWDIVAREPWETPAVSQKIRKEETKKILGSGSSFHLLAAMCDCAKKNEAVVVLQRVLGLLLVLSPGFWRSMVPAWGSGQGHGAYTMGRAASL